MGNCGGILCTKNDSNIKESSNKMKTDIVLQNQIDKDFLSQKYSEIPLLSKVIYLQKKIKSFLKKHKSKMRANKNNNKNKKNNKPKKQKYESKTNSKSASEDLKLNRNKDKTINENTTTDSQKNNKKENDQNNNVEEDDYMKIDNIEPHLMNSNLKYAFQKKDKNIYLEDDPRNLLNDNIRRYFPDKRR